MLSQQSIEATNVSTCDINISGHRYISADSKLCNVLFTLELARRLRPVR